MNERQTLVRFSGVQKTYDGQTLVVKDLHLDIQQGEFLSLLGPSGSGKTTTLMMLAGFESPTAGEITLRGASITRTPPHQRNFGMVFQNYALFPHMTVAQNIAYPLKVRKFPVNECDARVKNALEMVQMGAMGQRYPAQLSGGQQQRVALARALVFDPQLVLMDEPLGALDKQLREHMQVELKALHRQLGLTFVYVTHDQGEALTLSDRVAVFNEGVIQQVDTVDRLYEQPINRFVAGFVGDNTVLHGLSAGPDGLHLPNGQLLQGVWSSTPTGMPPVASTGQPVVASIRPERIIVLAEKNGPNCIAVQLRDVMYFGDHLRLRCTMAEQPEICVKVGLGQAALLQNASTLCLHLPPEHVRIYN